MFSIRRTNMAWLIVAFLVGALIGAGGVVVAMKANKMIKH